jgi:hypothetical protein
LPNSLSLFDIDVLFFYSRNGVTVEGATHKQVVDLIKSGGDVLTLTVISVTQQVSFNLPYGEYSIATLLFFFCGGGAFFVF